jgi:hypothetical protein
VTRRGGVSAGPSAWRQRTVRGGQADHPQAQGRPSENATRTSSTAPRKTERLCPTCGPSEGNSYRADCPRQAGRLSANTVQPKSTSPTDRTTSAQEQATNWTNTGPRELSAPTRRTVRQVQTEQLEPENEKSTSHIHPWISQTT